MQDIPVTILMGVYNGARHLEEQLASIAAQSHRNWRLIASDDGSSDESVALLERFGARVTYGPRKGFSNNFMSLLSAFPQGGDYLALCDQDDVWLPDHLERAIAALANTKGPAIYCARTWISDSALRGRKMSRGCPRGPDFRNALVQNIVAGNTIVANAAAAELLREVAPLVPEVPAHDWFIYQLISGAGGRVIFDDMPAVIYRQHLSNAMGANSGISAKMARLKLLRSGKLRQWLAQNEPVLTVMRPYLTAQAVRLIDDFAEVRAMPPSLSRGLALRRLGLYRQTRSSTAMFWLAASLGWI